MQRVKFPSGGAETTFVVDIARQSASLDGMTKSLMFVVAVVSFALPLDGAEPLRVMSFNIRYGTADDGENSWPHRRELVLDTIGNDDPHVLGLQEALRFQIDEIRTAHPHFDEAGVGRDDGREKGEYAAILFDRRRLQMIEQQTFWFSDTPEKVASTSWGNEIPRICTWAQFRERKSGEEFLVFNVHWDHVSQKSRERSAELLCNRIAGRELPALVTGDFNADERNPAFARLIEDRPPRLVDSFRVRRPQSDEVGTFNGFRGKRSGGKIDAVLATSQWQVLKAAIDRTERDGRFPSDHFPVTATVQLAD